MKKGEKIQQKLLKSGVYLTVNILPTAKTIVNLI